MPHTLKTAKELLPGVLVRLREFRKDGKGKLVIVAGKVSGRSNKFATVTVADRSHEVAWETIVRVLNSGSFITFD